MTSPQPETETSVQASLQRADQEIKTALKKLMDSASLLVTLPPGMRADGGLGLGPAGAAPCQLPGPAAGPAVVVHEAGTQTQAAEGHATAQRQVPAEEPGVPKPSPAPSREEEAAGGESTRERTVPIDRTSPDAGAGGWYRREGDVVWDVHSEVYIETTERTRVYKTEEKTPTSPPYMQVTIEDVQVNCGERAKFQAVIEGTPQPTVLWFKGTSLLTDSDRIHQGKEGTTYFLVVDNAALEDGGVYTCVAKNAGGEVLCKAELVVPKKDQEGKKVATRRKLHSHYEVKQEIGRTAQLCESSTAVLSFCWVKLYIKQILEGIKYLHDNNILHLDIKPLNILMVYPEREDLKICDFGFAQRITPVEPQYSKYGSPEFVAPEIVSQSPVSKASDIWAVGVITYLSLTCKSPFAGENDRKTLLNIQNGEISWTIPDVVHLSEDAKDFMKGILQQHPNIPRTHLRVLHNVPLEAAHFINTKQLKFIVARSKWQRSLMCYKSILVMRSIPEILERTHDNSSLAISRHLIEESTSSSTSGSSSDNENSSFPEKKHFGSTPELHLPVFDAPSHPQPLKCASEQEHSKSSIPPVKPMRRKYASMKAEVGHKPPTESKELMAGILEEKEQRLLPSLQEEPSQKRGTAEPSSPRASMESTSLLHQKGKPDTSLPEKAGDGTEKPSACVPRQSVIKSTFYSQATELPARPPSSPGRELRRHLDRARRTFRKAGYPKVPLSGLREPLLEQFELEEEEEGGDDSRESLLGSLTKSASFDSARKPPHPAIAGASRSRSLDDYRLRASRSLREQDILEEDCDVLSQESCPEGSDHCDTSTGPVSPERNENRKRLLKKSKATEIEEDVECLEGKSPIPTAQCSDVTAPSAPKDDSTEDKSDSDFQEGKDSISTLTQSEHTPKSCPSKGGVCLPQESAPTDTHPELTGGSLLIKRTAPAPPWKDKRQKHSDEKTSAHGTAESELMEHESSAVPTEQTDSLPVCKNKSEEIPGKSVPAATAMLGKQPGTLTAGEGAPQKLKTHKDVRCAVLEDAEAAVTGTTPPSSHGDESQAHQKAPAHLDTASAVLKGEPLAVPKIPPPGSVPALVSDGAQQALSKEKRAALRSKSSAATEVVSSLAHERAELQKAGHGVLEQHRAGILDGLQNGSSGALTASQPGVAPASAYELEYEEYAEDYGEGGGIALESGRCDAGTAAPPLLHRDHGQELPHHRSSFYSDEESAVLEGLVDEMVSLSEEMNVWAESVSGKKGSRKHISPQREMLYKGSQAHMDSSFSSVQQDGGGEVAVQDDFAEPYLAVSEEPGVLEEQGAQTVPHECEHLEDLAFELSPSSRESVSSTESLDTANRPIHVPLTKDTGKHPEVSLVKIKDLSDEAPSPGSGPQKFDISEVEPAYLNFSDLYDIDTVLFAAAVTDFPVNQTLVNKGTCDYLCVKAELSLPTDATGRRMALNDSSSFLTAEFGELGSEAAEKELLIGAEGSLKRKSALPSFKLPSLTPKEKAPSFMEELMDQAAAAGQCVTLSCRTAALSSLHITWFRDGIPVQGSSRILISSTLKHFQLLTILSVNAEDFGIYTCVATNSLGSASTSCVMRKAEVPPSPPPPDVVEVYKDGVQLVWKPVETNTPVHYTVQCKTEDGEWTTLVSDITDCCYYARNLPQGFIYHFRTACTSKAGTGPYSQPSAKVKITGKDHMEPRAATQEFPAAAPEEESEMITPPEPFPTYQTYAFQTEIKRGRFSIVRQCREKVSGKTLAAKIIPYWQEDKQAVLLEYQVLRKLHHTNIAQLKGAYVSPRHLVLIQEMCVGPELLHSLALRTSYSEVEVRDYLWQILSATEYLHAHNILHLDLRSENMIITEPNLLKLLDFGNAQFYTPDKFISMDKCSDYVETMAPELLTEQGALPQTDIWSIGITAFIMKGRLKLTRCYAGLSGGAVSFLQSTLCANPWGRPSASECLQSPWLQETGLDNRQQALVTFPTTKLRNFLMEREKKRGLLCSKYGLMIAQ
ncbi:hypothetical protein IHE44_0000060 [Lamprotornis superbus]|uniref:Obscurin n=1 Tax=Lamprotornis superbus TaxID=245042 RepID=A0A835NS44_9PASS|nr:hypothetical protein IHE44_0000060 [Lamprotornis superbus]